FNAGTNWAGGVVPGAADLARFNLNTNYTVSFDVSPTNAALLVSQGNVAFRTSSSTGRIYTVSGTANVSASSLSLTPSAGTMRLAIGGLLSIGGSGTT